MSSHNDYKATNDIEDLLFTFLERNRYYGNALEKDNGIDRLDGVIDLNRFGRVYYGRCDLDMDTILPKEDMLTYSSNPSLAEFGVQGVNYAVRAFEKFANDVNIAVASPNANFDEADPFLAKIKCFKSYSDILSPTQRYNAHINSIGSEFVEQMKNTDIINNITDFNDFVKHFLFFLQRYDITYPAQCLALIYRNCRQLHY